MDSILPFFIVGIFLAAFILIGVLSYQAQQKRLAEMATLAGEIGWRFVADTDYSLEDEFPQFSEFSRGHSRYAYNTLLGNMDIGGRHFPARMGDYRYRQTTGSGKSKSTHTYTFSYLIFKLPYAPLPDFAIRREGFFDSVAGALGFSDIDFELAEFNKRFHVKSADKKFAYDVINPAMMEYLLANDGPPLQIVDGCCCVTYGSGTWSADEFRGALLWTCQFFDHWPKYLTSDLESRV